MLSFGYQNKVIVSCLYLALTLALTHSSASANEDMRDIPMLNFTLGQVGVTEDIDDSLRFGVEYRMRSFSRWKLIPAIGYAHALNDANFFYADLRHDFWLNDRWVFIPSFGLGTFDDSEELRLGNDLEFRSGIEIAYRFRDQYRVGLALFHLSNGGLSDENPGTEALVLSICLPLSN